MLLAISVVKCVPSPQCDARLAISEDKKKNDYVFSCIYEMIAI